MAEKLEFVFDFSSPYGYLGATVADRIMTDFPKLEVVWRPYLMGAAMKQTGIPALVEIPIKSRYVAHDMIRSAQRLNVPLTMPANFPFKSLAVCRAFYAIEAEVGQPGAQAFARAVYRACFGQGQKITGIDVLAKAAVAANAPDWAQDTIQLQERLLDQGIKDQLRAVTDALIARGCWGSPHFIVDEDEMFWGNDKRWELWSFLTGE